MLFDNFKRIVTTFADEDSEMAWDGDGTLLLGIRGIEVVAKIMQTPNGIQVEHDDVLWNAEQWIWSYLAKLDRLADRITRSVSPPDHYVSPSGKLLDWENQPEKEFSDAKQELQKRFSQHPVDMTLIYFLTSDAGEGKTSLIEKISVDQAEAFKRKDTQTLVLPVSLGGRPFLRLDDAVIASLSNRFRFPFLYYDSFIELVKMGVIIPAFDGYEEMLAETKSGEAISAIGDLVDQLSSNGTLLVAARKAYFDSSFSSQSKLLDSVRREQKVDVCRIALDRWSREVFLKYAKKRNVPTPPQELHGKVARKLKNDKHPVLTRAVLVRRLIDVVTEEGDLDKFLQRLGQSPTDYFFDFVEGIVEREAREKWIDTSGTKKSSLLTKDEHHELLSQIAFEMWVNGVETIGLDVVRLVVQIFVEEKNLTPAILRQINNRINHHSLLRLDDSAGSIKRIRFDHEDFRAFYLGQALARALDSRDESNARLILDAHQLSNPVTNETARYLTSLDTSVLGSKKVIEYLHHLAGGQQPVSYIRENCGTLMLELAERTAITHSITGVNFPENALEQRKIKNLNVSNSLFNSTSLSNSNILNCTFENCRFVELALNGKHNLDGTVFDDECSFDSVSVGNDFDGEYRKFFNPNKVKAVLKNHGFILGSQQNSISEHSDLTKMDKNMKIALRFIRMFARSTVVAENTVRTRLGTQHGVFFNNILSKLQKADLIEPISSPGNRRRYRLIVPLSEIDELVENSGSTFEQFIANASNH
ncbi:MAG: hypothetical protein F4065_06285 [Rhodothermaceae bacterium]|nr:hypothetical protein [Rhodothermaceae bacterium]MXZ57663.1 hypothetical protein [Rhodothermaceae bacterium]MYB91323.1 hypothetical protein [Rhodothermaceae bacterium]MYD68764.1 hypothetical protein [Rhodothermaceae bacterium]MYG45418.1 hypothetical protein [Rhodothermaceae bacterium]